jgi:hypothetical protein
MTAVSIFVDLTGATACARSFSHLLSLLELSGLGGKQTE